MKKLYIDKEESAASVVERVLGEKDDEVRLIIPRDSKLKESVVNFRLLKREAEDAGKELEVESVDEEVLSMAQEAGLTGGHPLLGGASRSLSDIVSVDALPRHKKEEKPFKKASTKKKVALRVHLDEKEEERREKAEEKFFSAASEVAPPEPLAIEPRRKFRPKLPSFRRRWLAVTLGVVVVVGLGLWTLGAFFAKAQISINFKTQDWSLKDSFSASKSATDIKPDQKILPAEVFHDARTLTQLFPASGKDTVSQKATGQITIYNAYSSQPQQLVATTRLETPDGKIFRLDDKVTVPGAIITNGKIEPSSIKATVTADKAGTDYNIGPVTKLTIPGFKGSAKFAGFYGSLDSAASGGFIGERAVPTDADIAAAKTKMTDMLKTSLSNNFLAGRPSDFKILDGADDTEITRLVVKNETDGNGQFTAFGEADYKAIGFRESDFKSLLTALANKDNPGTSFRQLDITYSGVKANYTTGELTFAASAQGKLAASFDADKFREGIMGKKVSDVRNMILQLSGLNDAKVSIWPVWVSTIPTSANRVKINSN